MIIPEEDGITHDLSTTSSLRWYTCISIAAYDCKKVSLNVASIRKPNKVRDNYGIPDNERLVAFCKGSPILPLTMSGVIFTDHAIYSKCTSGTEDLRIEYPSLGQYLLTQEGKKGKACAQTSNGDIQIIGSTLVGENAAGAEIIKILRYIQRELILEDPAAKSELDNLVGTLTAPIIKNTPLGNLSRKDNAILDALVNMGDYADSAAKIKAEMLFRHGDESKYFSFVESLDFLYVSFDVKMALMSVPATFSDNYVTVLTDLNQDYEEKELSAINKRIHTSINKIRRYQIICGYISIRTNNTSSAKKDIASVRTEFGDYEANRLEWFNGTYGYHRLFQVYDAIRNQQDLSGINTNARDGLGLTPLHYALILKDDKAIDQLLEKRTWLKYSPVPEQEDFEELYDYALLVCGKQLPGSYKILKRVSQEAAESVEQIERLKKKEKMLSTSLDVLNKNLRYGKKLLSERERNGADYHQIAEVQEKIEEIRCNMAETEDRIRETKYEIFEENQNLDSIIESVIENTLIRLADMGRSKDPFVKYLYRIYFEPGFFDQVLWAAKEEQGLHLYEYHGLYFIAPELAEINLPCCEDTDSSPKSEETDYSDHPLYGTSWFSKDAHTDAGQLKKEYRKLAKTFHPDVSSLPNSKEIFQQISAEYEQILSTLES